MNEEIMQVIESMQNTIAAQDGRITELKQEITRLQMELQVLAGEVNLKEDKK